MIIRLIRRIRSNVLPHPGLRFQLLQLEIVRSRDDLALTIAQKLPARLTYWVIINALARHLGPDEAATFPAMGVLDRIDRESNLHPRTIRPWWERAAE